MTHFDNNDVFATLPFMPVRPIGSFGDCFPSRGSILTRNFPFLNSTRGRTSKIALAPRPDFSKPLSVYLLRALNEGRVTDYTIDDYAAVIAMHMQHCLLLLNMYGQQPAIQTKIADVFKSTREAIKLSHKLGYKPAVKIDTHESALGVQNFSLADLAVRWAKSLQAYRLQQGLAAWQPAPGQLAC